MFQFKNRKEEKKKIYHVVTSCIQHLDQLFDLLIVEMFPGRYHTGGDRDPIQQKGERASNARMHLH